MEDIKYHLPCEARSKVEYKSNIVLRMWRHATLFLEGNLKEQFRMLRSYAIEVLWSNQWSIVFIALKKRVFQGIYICFEACK